jgi:uncharacterized protein HemY
MDRRVRRMPETPPALLAETGDLAALAGQRYSARAYWERALERGSQEDVEPLPQDQREQLWALLGIDAMQREDFAGAEEYLSQASQAEGVFGEAASLYQTLAPVLKERLQ